MSESMQPCCIDGCTLLNIQLCKERIRRKFALELALEAARIRNAQIYQSVFSQTSFPAKPVRLGCCYQGKEQERPFGPCKSAWQLRSNPGQRSNLQQGSACRSDLQLRSYSRVRSNSEQRSKSYPSVCDSEKQSSRNIASALTDTIHEIKTSEESPRTNKSKTDIDTKSQRSVRLNTSQRSIPATDIKSQTNLLPKAQKSQIKVSDVVSKAKKRVTGDGSKTQKTIPEIFSKDKKNKRNEQAVEKQQKQKKRVSGSKSNLKSRKEEYTYSDSELESIDSMSRKDRSMDNCQSRPNLCEKSQKTQKMRGRSSDRFSASSTGGNGQKGKLAESSSSKSKGNKNRNNQQQQQQPTETYICTCSTCGGQTTCCCVEDLEAINEESDVPDFGDDGSTSNQCYPQCKPSQKCTSSADEEDACGEFFDIMRDSMEDAVKKSLEDVFGRYFSNCMQKLDCLGSQMECSQNMLSKMYTDLNDKISYYGERNAQQFQYLCVRMEHDRLFYQQQQEYFLKATNKKAGGPESADDCDQQDSGGSENICIKPPNMKCRVQSLTTKCELGCGNDDKHVKSRHWECCLVDDDQTDQEVPGESTAEDTDDDGKKNGRRSKSKGGKNEAPEKLGRKKSDPNNADSGKKGSKKK